MTSLSLFGLFLWRGTLTVFDLAMPLYSALAWDTAICLVFFLQHSCMVRRRFRIWLERVVPACWHGAVYTICSGVALLLLLFWQPSGIDVAALRGPAAWSVRVLFFAALAVFAWGIHSLASFDAFGIDALLAHFRHKKPADMPLAITGPYRFVRHPFYAAGILAIWACPALSLDRILFNVLFTGWIAIGARLEERDLVAQFGETYRRYQSTTPMLIPWPRRQRHQMARAARKN